MLLFGWISRIISVSSLLERRNVSCLPKVQAAFLFGLLPFYAEDKKRKEKQKKKKKKKEKEKQESIMLVVLFCLSISEEYTNYWSLRNLHV